MKNIKHYIDWLIDCRKSSNFQPKKNFKSWKNSMKNIKQYIDWLIDCRKSILDKNKKEYKIVWNEVEKVDKNLSNKSMNRWNEATFENGKSLVRGPMLSWRFRVLLTEFLLGLLVIVQSIFQAWPWGTSTGRNPWCRRDSRSVYWTRLRWTIAASRTRLRITVQSCGKTARRAAFLSEEKRAGCWGSLPRGSRCANASDHVWFSWFLSASTDGNRRSTGTGFRETWPARS